MLCFLDADKVDDHTDPEEDIDAEEDEPYREEDKTKKIPALFATIWFLTIAVVPDDLASEPPRVGSVQGGDVNKALDQLVALGSIPGSLYPVYTGQHGPDVGDHGDEAVDQQHPRLVHRRAVRGQDDDAGDEHDQAGGEEGAPTNNLGFRNSCSLHCVF